MKKFLSVVAASLLIVGLIGCDRKEEATKIDLSKREKIKIMPDKKSVRIAISAMISPKETFVYYKAILDYYRAGVPL